MNHNEETLQKTKKGFEDLQKINTVKINYILNNKDEFRVFWIGPEMTNASDPKLFGIHGKYGRKLQEPLQPVIMSCSVDDAIAKFKYDELISDEEALINCFAIYWAKVHHKPTGVVFTPVN